MSISVGLSINFEYNCITDVASWCYKWDGMGSLGTVRYRTPYDAKRYQGITIKRKYIGKS